MSELGSVRSSHTVTVMGAGSWGTAFALVLADAGHQVTLWARRPELCVAINAEHHNPDYLSEIELPAAVRAVADPREALDAAELIVLAVPSQTLRANLTAWLLPAGATVVSLAKGIELDTGLRMSEVITGVGGVPASSVAVVTGPNLAREIAQRQPSASVVASTSEQTAERVQQACHTASFRPYTNTDVIGCELGGATKNVIALAVGMGIGLGFGDNAMASVITRGLAEISRLGAALGADPHTFSGLAGLGDLVATCASPLSRNRTFGEELGRGRSVADIAGSTRQVAEGVKSCAAIRDLGRSHGIELPIVDHVVQVVAGELTPAEGMTSLLARAAGRERS